MLQELINRAKNIEATTDANLGGAVNQVTKGLSIDEMEQIYREVFPADKLDRKLRLVRAARDGSERTAMMDLRASIYTIIENRARQ